MPPEVESAVLRGSTGRYACRCCGCLTLPERPPGTFNICPVCWWEDDSPEDYHRNRRPGPNRVTLEEAQDNYRVLGVSDPAYSARVRPMQAGEQPPACN